jgi:hypothetical protein
MQCHQSVKIYKFADIRVEGCGDHQDTATTLHFPESFTNRAIHVHIHGYWHRLNNKQFFFCLSF